MKRFLIIFLLTICCHLIQGVYSQNTNKSLNNQPLKTKDMEALNKSTEETRTIVEDFYNKTALGDVKGIVGLMSDDVEWEIPGNEDLASWVGRKKEKTGVNEFYTLLNENTRNLIFRVDKLFVDGEQAVAIGYVSTIMLKTNKVFNSYFMAHFTVSDKQITKYFFAEDSFRLTKALAKEEKEHNSEVIENVDIVKKYFREVSARNIDEVNTLFSPDIEVYFPQSGVLKGIDNLLLLNKSLAESIEQIEYDFNYFVYTISDNKIIVEGIESGTFTNNETFTDKRFCSVFEIKNGLIHRMYVYSNLDT